MSEQWSPVVDSRVASFTDDFDRASELGENWTTRGTPSARMVVFSDQDAGNPLTVAELERLLERFTYKPGWEFRIVEHENFARGLVLLVGFYAPDSTRLNASRRFSIEYDDRDFVPGAPYSPRRHASVTMEVEAIGGRYQVPPFHSEQTFWMWLRGIVRYMEDHEMDEWFKVDGKPVNDPHAHEKREAQRRRDDPEVEPWHGKVPTE